MFLWDTAAVSDEFELVNKYLKKNILYVLFLGGQQPCKRAYSRAFLIVVNLIADRLSRD